MKVSWRTGMAATGVLMEVERNFALASLKHQRHPCWAAHDHISC